MYQPFDFDQAAREMIGNPDFIVREKDLVISKVRQVPSPYQSMYILEETGGLNGGFSIYGISRVTGKNPEYFLISNALKNFVDAFLTFDEAEHLVVKLQKAAKDTEIKVNVQPSTLTQDELRQLDHLLSKARLILNSSEANVFVCLDEELGELVLFGEVLKGDDEESLYRTISSQGVSDDSFTTNPNNRLCTCGSGWAWVNCPENSNYCG